MYVYITVSAYVHVSICSYICEYMFIYVLFGSYLFMDPYMHVHLHIQSCVHSYTLVRWACIFV